MRQSVAVLAVGVVALASVDTASAIPAFARRYGVECHMCHQGFPKLNRTGERFKQRGFRLESEDPFKVEDWIKSIPIRARVSGSSYSFEGADDTLDFGYIKVVSAGSLGSRVSYWVDDGFFFDDDEESDVHQNPDNAWARVELLKGGKLYTRGGRIELDIPFTQARTPQLFSYDIYYANTGSEIDNLAAFRYGMEVGGSLKDDTYHWSVALAGGAKDEAGEALFESSGLDDPTDDLEGNVFLRLARRGDAHRFGVFGYFGQNTLARGLASQPQTWSNKLVRVGGDVDLWFSKLNVYGLYMYGRNSDAAPSPSGVGGLGQSSTFHGGFLQADYHVFEKEFSGFLKEIALQLTLRGNYAKLPTQGLDVPQAFTSAYPGVRLFVRERFRFVFEYGFQGEDRPRVTGVSAEFVF